MILSTSAYNQQTSQWDSQQKIFFFQTVQRVLLQELPTSNFADLVNLRQKNILYSYPYSDGDLASIFESSQAIKHILSTPMADCPTNWHSIEISAIELFGSLLAGWAEYERYLILQKNQALDSIELNIMSLSLDEKKYYSEYVSNIEKDTRYFTTLHCSIPLPLADAISLINLDTFVIEQKWYEILFTLHLSQQGSHVLVFYHDKDFSPILVSTALIQHWHKRENWLSFDPFFKNPKWQNCLVKDSVKYLYQTGVFSEKIFDAKLYNDSIIEDNLSDTDAVCEILRLTVSGRHRFRIFLIFLCQKHLAKQLIAIGKKLSYTIIESPLMLDLYDFFGKECYLNHSCYDINNSNIKTYKGFWNNQEINNKFKNINYEEYKLIMKYYKIRRDSFE
ncbi:Acyl-homoserine-lactone synthase LuxM [Vibrio ruber DSM 16370]|uniref:acyl-homoserine-lactone synthase n=1 Tax=Vibrio ruber (strain DSM 16370 / JCM 11486 / BCRC 17186 / CECT 7878 / LMG 23124 / VR1) TaxID=1123498 RepID=A0A1R4LQ81_VIBR1|nr:acyl-homoserine-lactone synthase [Vibrio ruber]SJN58675.1 Acyl-homoserine-lactone synthase LuxM [Vibrio ruber DSM 16370]